MAFAQKSLEKAAELAHSQNDVLQREFIKKELQTLAQGSDEYRLFHQENSKLRGMPSFQKIIPIDTLMKKPIPSPPLKSSEQKVIKDGNLTQEEILSTPD